MDVNATGAALLGLLRDGPRSGHELARAAAQELGEFWTVTRSQVYRELSAMAAAGLVQAQDSGARDRRPYALTAAGRAAFRAWLHAQPGGDGVRIPRLLRLAFVGELAPARLAELVQSQRDEHAARLAGYQRDEQAALSAGAQAGDLVVLRFGLAYERAVLTWLDDVVPDVLTARRAGAAEQDPPGEGPAEGGRG